MHSPSARALLAAVVDYAGLFPPAALSMPEAVAEYAAAQRGSDAWMLGRFVLTAARLPEFAEVMASMAAPAAVWRLSAIVRDGSQVDRDAIGAFNAASADHHAIVDTIEVSRSGACSSLERCLKRFHSDFGVAFRLP